MAAIDNSAGNGSAAVARPSLMRRLRWPLMVVVPVAMIAAAAIFYLNGGRYESTDDAYVQAARVQVSASIPGRVVAVLVKENQPVRAGQVLFRIDSRDYDVAIANARAQLAQARLQGFVHAEVHQSRLPGDWPEDCFDLIVLSELGYYLNRADWLHLIADARQSLAPDGQLLACHWRPPIENCPQSAEQVHELLDEHLHLPRLLQYRDADFMLDLWGRDSRSVATLEGLR